MEAVELMRELLRDAGLQLERALEGMSEAQMDFKITPVSMSPREQLAHLGEAYQALLTEMNGGKHQWGTYDPGDRATGPLKEHTFNLRSQAVEAALTEGNHHAIKHAHDYVLAHDYYHVGQICAARVVTDSEWDAYSIYNFATT